MRLLFLISLFLPIATSNLLANFSQPEFFDIVIDRDHPDRVYKAFEDFIAKFNRKYKDEKEKSFRFNNFVKAYNTVNELNDKSQKAGKDTKFGINKFSDWTSAEFSRTLSHVPPANMTALGDAKPFSFPKSNTSRVKRQSSRYPDSFDLRDEKVNGRHIVGPVKDQGECACCWGFAVTAVMETANAVSSGKFSSLSDQEICDCATDGTPGCVGGSLDMGIRYVKKYGQSGDWDYPYDQWRAHKGRRCLLKSTRRVIPARVMEFVAINRRKAESEIMYILTNWRVPVAVYFKVGHSFKQYKDGVLSDEDCYGSEWHGGAIVGYDTNRHGENYWIVKNSWGDNSWGLNGYVYIKRGIDWCAIEESPVTGDMSSHKNDY